MIELEDLRKTFTVHLKRARLRRERRVVQAVRGISVSIEAGSLVGYLGPNGAGKSTTIKMLTGILVPSGGRVRVAGLEPSRQWIELARQMREAGKRGEDLKLTEDELAFYDALEVNDSAVKVLGEPTLTKIAHELVETIRNSVTIDWTEREAVRAKIRVAVKRILRKYGYPPDKQEKATQTVLQQAELLCADWAG